MTTDKDNAIVFPWKESFPKKHRCKNIDIDRRHFSVCENSP